jgi:hypothetical protein
MFHVEFNWDTSVLVGCGGYMLNAFSIANLMPTLGLVLGFAMHLNAMTANKQLLS